MRASTAFRKTPQKSRRPVDEGFVKMRLVMTLVLGSAGIAAAQQLGTPADDPTNLSLDEFQLELTSFGRKARELSKAPAAIYVLTAEDTRRSGATSVPEALEGVAGLPVQSVDGRM
jgi:iron complex outermembrane receptor protein